MNEHPGGRFGIVFEHLSRATEGVDIGIVPVSPAPPPQGDLLSADELEEMRELRDLVDEISDPAPMLFTTD